MSADAAKPQAAGDEGGKQGEQPKLQRELNTFDLIVLGVGGIVGAGIFVVSGEAAYKYAGPAVILSFAVAGLCSTVYALCFAELAAMVRSSLVSAPACAHMRRKERKTECKCMSHDLSRYAMFSLGRTNMDIGCLFASA